MPVPIPLRILFRVMLLRLIRNPLDRIHDSWCLLFSSDRSGRIPNPQVSLGKDYHKLYLGPVRALLAVFSMHTRIRVSCYGYHGLRAPQPSHIQYITLIAFPHWTKVYTTRSDPIISRDVQREDHSQDILTNPVIVYDRMGGSEEAMAVHRWPAGMESENPEIWSYSGLGFINARGDSKASTSQGHRVHSFEPSRSRLAGRGGGALCAGYGD